MTLRTEIDDYVKEIWDTYGVSLPVNLKKLAKKLQINVSEDSLDNEGYFVNYNGSLYIFLNKDFPYELRKRFTLAHEIGHALLHPDSEIINQKSNREEIFNYSKELETLEQEANYFAAELLLPKRIINTLLPNETFDLKTVDEIAEKAKISRLSALIKCVENSKTHNELLLFYDEYNELRWYNSADEDFTRDTLPSQKSDLEDFLEETYETIYSEETHTVQNKKQAVLISGKKRDWINN